MLLWKRIADAIRLRMPHLGFGVLNAVQRQVELVIMGSWLTAIFGPSIGQHANHAHALLGKELQYSVVQ